MVLSRRNTKSLTWGVIYCFLVIVSLDVTESRQISDSDENSTIDSLFSSTQTTVAICVSALIFVVVAIVAIFKCGDCYNSEVSTEFHPASNGSGQKWGGAVGYSSENTRGSGITFGETVDPNAGQSLPYSMIPTSIPEQGGFAGYHTGSGGGGEGAVGSPMMGYQNYSNTTAHTTQNNGGGSRHYNPAEEQPPPPTYTDYLRHSHLHENR